MSCLIEEPDFEKSLDMVHQNKAIRENGAPHEIAFDLLLEALYWLKAELHRENEIGIKGFSIHALTGLVEGACRTLQEYHRHKAQRANSELVR